MDAGAHPPDSRELRNFGLLLGALIAAFFGALPYLIHHHLHVWPFAIAAILWAGALLIPAALRPVHAGWTRFGLALGWINTRVVLTIFFAIAIVPVGLAMRLFGRDPMRRGFDRSLESYRTPSRRRPARDMENPF